MQYHHGPNRPQIQHRNSTSLLAIRIFIVAVALCILQIVYFLVFQARSLFPGITVDRGDHFLIPAITSNEIMPPNDLVVVAPTYYNCTQDPRYLLAADACRQASIYGIRLILIDASPSQEVKIGLETAGIRRADGKKFVYVKTQTSKGKKGVALREGIEEALHYLMEQAGSSKNIDESFIGFTELEKVDLFRHFDSIVQYMNNQEADICVPKRREVEFQASYPIEQFHSEMFANYFLNSLGASLKIDPIDWTNGPVVFRASQATHWLAYAGELWDAQLVPLVDAHITGAKVSSFEIDYKHPEVMKSIEEGAAVWNEKRLYQLNVLSDTVGKRMKEYMNGSDA
jgi:hypothetical protein